MAKVNPLHYYDDIPLFHKFAMTLLFVYDDRLDPRKLRESLENLVQQDGWQKLGARLRRSQSGGLEYHTPSSFDEHCPAIMFRLVQHSCSVSEHPNASKLPVSTDCPSVLADTISFRSLAFHPETPRLLQDYLDADIPQLGLFVNLFDDATLVSLSFPHTLCDMVGAGVLLKGWQAMLDNRLEDLPRL